MRQRLLVTFALLVCIASAFGQSTPRVEALFPSDVPGVLVVRDWPALRKKGITHPLAAIAGDPRFAKFLAPLFKQIALEAAQEAGPKLNDVLSLGTGQFAVTVDPRWLLEPGAPESAVSSRVLVADIGDNGPAVSRMMLGEAKPAPATRPASPPGWTSTPTSETYEGVVLHLTSAGPDAEHTRASGWAIVGKQLVIAEPAETLKRTVHTINALAVDARPVSRLEELPAYRQVVKLEPDADVFLFVNVPAVIAPMLKKVDKEYLSEFHGSFFKLETYFALSPAGFSRVLGTDDIEALYFALNVGSRATELGMGMLHGPPRGLIPALAFMPGQPVPPWVPAEAVEASAAHFDFAQAWRAGIDAVTSFRYCDQRVREALAGASAAGVDVENDLIASLGTQVAYAELAVAQPNSRDRLLVIDLKDAAKFEAGLVKIIPWLNHDEHAKAQPGGVYPLKDVDAFFDGAIAARVAVANGKLLLTLGRAEAMDGVLKQMRQANPASYWDKPAARDALAQMPADAVGFGFRDGASAVINAMPLLSTTDLFDVGATPEPAAFNEYLPRVVTTIRSTDGLKSMRIRLEHPAKIVKPAPAQ